MLLSEKPKVLVTNDDGIDSPFLKILAQALESHFDLRIVAPSSEQSWIGKAMSRRGFLDVSEVEFDGLPAWSVGGTPADCVNLAVGNLFANERFSAVVSGINIGYNASIGTVMSSGTVGAAMEGALMGIPAVALSKSLSQDWYEFLQTNRDELHPDLEVTLKADAGKIPTFVENAITDGEEEGFRAVVHNYNFPIASTSMSPVVETKLARAMGASLFEAVEGAQNRYRFRYQPGQNIDDRTKTDLNCLSDGHISYTLIDFTLLT